jgi:hypothetical protein
VATLVAGCGVSREQGIGRSLAEYDYVVLRPKDTHQYHAAAMSILDQSFVAGRGDPRLDICACGGRLHGRHRPCAVLVLVGMVDVLDHDTLARDVEPRPQRHVLDGRERGRHGGDRDVAAARRPGRRCRTTRARSPPLPKTKCRARGRYGCRS